MQAIEGFNTEFQNYYKDYYKQIFNEFCAWLTGIEEDTPLPSEIKYVQFMLMKNSNLYNLSFSGHELMPKRINSGSYQPLEGQYFFNKHLISIHFISKNENLKRQFINYLIKNLILDFLKTQKANYLKNKKIILGFAFSKPVIIKE